MNPHLIYLCQTDTTVGFLSQNAEALSHIKKRPEGKPFLKVLPSFESLSKETRIPKAHRKFIRNSDKTTFAFPGTQAYRVIRDRHHQNLIRRFGWMHSTSANPSGQEYDPDFAKEKADVIIEDSRGLFEGTPSRIIRLGKSKKRKLRA